jgi:ATP-dependent exoDNAse (exonuclease V) beta subunit
MTTATKSGRPLSDADARRRIRDDLGATLFVEAAAGTGKTSALVSRIVSLLRMGKGTLDRVVAVTFTEKAAGEMKLRLRAEIENARGEQGLADKQRSRLERALAELELARIGTIHAFCGDLLRERPVEAGVDPRFEVAPEDESQRMLGRAFESWFQRTLAEPTEGVRRVLRRRPRGWRAQGPREMLRVAAASLIDHRDFGAPWRREPFDRDAAIDGVMERLVEIGALAARAASPTDYLAQNLAEIQAFVDETRQLEAVRGRDHDGLEAELRDLAKSRRVHWHWRGSLRRRYAADLDREALIARRDAVKAELDAVLEACDADLAPLLREELRPVVEEYERLKQRAGKLDFLDLLVRARNLIRDERGVREELQKRFTHFFVDEFQDTDPLQAEILLLLAAEDPGETNWRRVTPIPGKLFLVGDPKQSIYRFRRADVAIYEATKRQLTERGAEVVQLETSFRGLPSLQKAVNAAFEPLMRGSEDGSQADYVALQPWREDVRGRPAIVALPVPRPYGDYGRVVRWKIEESFPDAVGAFVHWLVEKSGWTVVEPGHSTPVAIEPRHVCLLFRRFKSYQEDVTRPYVRALEARRVPHVLVGGRSFHDRDEVLAIRNALCAIEWPDDELRVFATLRGPLFALGDDPLLAFRHRVGRFHPLRRLDGDALEASDREVAEALAVLARLHAGRNRRPIADEQLLRAVRAHAGIAIWPTGEQALANCLRMIDLARRFERRGAPSFRAFVERMEEEAERGETEDAPVVEEGTEGVRIMTVHRAKGLEFPVVVLADPTCNAARAVPSRHVDPARGLWAEPLCGCAPRDLLDAAGAELRRDAAESVRLAYVAATRARDLLVVPTVGDEEVAGWLDVLNPVVYPETRSRRESADAPGCSKFGGDSVFERPESARKGAGASVRPGLHEPRAGKHRVVWWDPRALDLDRSEEVGLRQQRILEADAGEVHADEGIHAHERWQASRRQALESGAKPSIAVQSVTSLAAARAESGESGGGVAVQEVALDRSGRPGGKRFGTLVHAVLAAVDLDADEPAVRAASRAHGRLVGASDDEVDAAAVAARAALAHPLLRRAAASAATGGLRRETPVLLRLDDGSLAEGVVDLAFREAGDGNGGDAGAAGDGDGSVGAAWTVVDFKTDRELDDRRASYEAQVRLYADAVAQATSEPTRAVLLIV